MPRDPHSTAESPHWSSTQSPDTSISTSTLSPLARLRRETDHGQITGGSLTTPMDTPVRAFSRVVRIPELLHEIGGHLDRNSLKVSMSVCTAFHDILGVVMYTDIDLSRPSSLRQFCNYWTPERQDSLRNAGLTTMPDHVKAIKLDHRDVEDFDTLRNVLQRQVSSVELVRSNVGMYRDCTHQQSCPILTLAALGTKHLLADAAAIPHCTHDPPLDRPTFDTLTFDIKYADRLDSLGLRLRHSPYRVEFLRIVLSENSWRYDQNDKGFPESCRSNADEALRKWIRILTEQLSYVKKLDLCDTEVFGASDIVPPGVCVSTPAGGPDGECNALYNSLSDYITRFSQDVKTTRSFTLHRSNDHSDDLVPRVPDWRQRQTQAGAKRDPLTEISREVHVAFGWPVPYFLKPRTTASDIQALH